MPQKKVLIIGGGIAGLCAGVYLRKSGFETEILEMHTSAGGLATAWKRKGYTFENCVHWLVGSREGRDLHSAWKEVFDTIKHIQTTDDYELRWKEANLSRVKEILCSRHDFSETRIDASMEKLIKEKEKRTQKGLGDFFK